MLPGPRVPPTATIRGPFRFTPLPRTNPVMAEHRLDVSWDSDRRVFLATAPDGLRAEGETPVSALEALGRLLQSGASASPAPPPSSHPPRTTPVRGTASSRETSQADAQPSLLELDPDTPAPAATARPSRATRLVHIYTDGACSPNPGPGGWGAVLLKPGSDKVRELSGADPETTNNRMELTAAVRALEALKEPCKVVLHTDSQYLRNAFTQGWLRKWQANGWRTGDRNPVLNQDLWRMLIEQDRRHAIEWKWVRGHANDEWNERCDRLAVEARKRLVSEK